MTASFRALFAPSRDPLWTAVLALLASIAASAVVIALSGKNPADGLAWMIDGAFGGPGALGETGVKAGVLILTGLSVAVAFTVGLFNIGAEGQLIWGALAGAVVGRARGVPALVHVPLCLAAAATAGAAWGFIPGLLRVKRGVHEVISTILLNWIAIHLVQGWLVAGPLAAATAGADISVAGTGPIARSAWLPRLLPGSRLDLGVFISLAIAVAVRILLTRTCRGFEWRAVGTGREAAYASGIPEARRTCEAMSLAGALAGVGGALLVLGTEHRFPGVFRTGYGFDGIAVALLGGGTAFGTAVAGLFFGAVRAGATRLQILGIHPSFAELIQGIAVILVAAPRIFQPLLSRLRRREGPRAAAPPVPQP